MNAARMPMQQHIADVLESETPTKIVLACSNTEIADQEVTSFEQLGIQLRAIVDEHPGMCIRLVLFYPEREVMIYTSADRVYVEDSIWIKARGGITEALFTEIDGLKPVIPQLDIEAFRRHL
jgi:hypothetical protein